MKYKCNSIVKIKKCKQKCGNAGKAELAKSKESTWQIPVEEKRIKWHNYTKPGGDKQQQKKIKGNNKQQQQ